MQTFAPYADFEATARALDAKRLGKQRVEVIQIVRALTVPGYALSPATDDADPRMNPRPAMRRWLGIGSNRTVRPRALAWRMMCRFARSGSCLVK
ncbi:MAG TPA: pyrimidine dimer DNA glycosylase/endonuclease V [Dermatophilaceae bacterium]|nr:pyrimidine dimer DNA glycosylase/endonuclease V [Dermatophilaceae bacterium]